MRRVGAELRPVRKARSHVEHPCDDAAVHDATWVQVMRLQLQADLARAVAERNELETHPAREVRVFEARAHRRFRCRVKHGAMLRSLIVSSQMNDAASIGRRIRGHSERPDQLLGPPVPSPFTDVLYSAERGVAGRKVTHVQRWCQHR